jgi:hypothetical protein
MPRYNHYELMNCDVLPDDCNAEAEEYARKFLSPELMVGMETMRKKKFNNGYGKITHLSEIGIPEVMFKFQRGVCECAVTFQWIGKKTVIQGTVQIYQPHSKD